MTTANQLAGYASSLPNFRNRIINGDMRIDQRNAGSSVAWLNANNLPVDRWKSYAASGSGHTAQQSTDVPSGSGFNNSVKLTVGTGASPSSSNLNIFYHVIEGYNISDLMFGSTNAKSVTLSFWVKSSGLPSYPATFSASLQDGTIGTGIPKEYIINSSDTWEYKTLTFIGDVNTGSTYSKTNGIGLYLTFDLGSGFNYEGSANVWSSGNKKTTSSSVKLIETSGATFYITGVQLEEGTVATEFEHRPYGLELSLCQRYYQARSGTEINAARAFATDIAVRMNVFLINPMRANPSVTLIGSTGWSVGGSPGGITNDYFRISGNSSSEAYITGYTANAEL